MFHLEGCIQNIQQEGALKIFSSLFNELSEKLGFLSASDKIFTPELLRKPVVDAPNFGQDVVLN